MQVEPKALTFGEQTKDVIVLTNSSQERFVFKVKVTNTQLFNIYPGKGIIEPSEVIHIHVVLKMGHKGFSAKLLVQWAPVPAQEEDVAWSSLDKQTIQDEVIPITGVKEEQTRAAGTTGYKKTQSPLYEPEIEASKSSNQSLRMSRPSHQERAAPIALTGTLYETVQETRRVQRSTTTIKMESSGTFNLERELKTEKERNGKLKQRLSERQNKLKHYQNLSQKDINDSLGQTSDNFQWGSCNICLLVIVCLFFGFLIAKTSSPSTATL